jgi:diadenosine tetraphosphate (Ap4A) HIT family hydrolase
MSIEPECVFCQIVARQAPAEIVYQDHQATAFMDIRPVTAGHTLVVPNQHSSALRNLPDEDAAYLLPIAKKLTGAMLQSDLRCEAVNLFLADGAAAGQSVFHTHLHLIPRFIGDSSGIRLHGSGAPMNPTPLSEAAAVIRSALEKLDA